MTYDPADTCTPCWFSECPPGLQVIRDDCRCCQSGHGRQTYVDDELLAIARAQAEVPGPPAVRDWNMHWHDEID